MKTDKFLLLFLIIITILVYFFKHENFWFLFWSNVLLVTPQELFGRIVMDSKKKISLLSMGYSSAFAIGFAFMFSWHGAILFGMFFGLLFSGLFLSFTSNAQAT
ncbi:MAG: hypothetical protein A3J46_01360 [Candidatus Yanofskybacteria bacterium RIFCSPHIGHO2_02_FULL_41_11]|uniref:Uncharacterized protein n=1 Tax=Candidatus Yanofskybacteria bacterium RIFCSPHIGHO2_02_FULL_41_11 TaxID=1802675 RepID=A0A1F8F8F7_9BACT|nr:MAG: hypothetical protein A3J46_01360 [Candidatus Yanofskybacteria bacterium RIFCSPHIGHO2_02_FULL_41_11]